MLLILVVTMRIIYVLNKLKKRSDVLFDTCIETRRGTEESHALYSNDIIRIWDAINKIRGKEKDE